MRNVHKLKQFILSVTADSRPTHIPATQIYYDIPSECNVHIHLEQENGTTQKHLPKLIEANSPTLQGRIRDVCTVTHGNQVLRVVVMASGKLRACNETMDRLEWIAEGYLPEMEHLLNVRSVTADNQGYILAYDKANACVHKFNTRGEYVGCVLREKEQGLETIQQIRWSSMSSSLVVSYSDTSGQCHISVVKLRS